MWFICEMFDFAYIILLTYIVESVAPYFRVISFVEWQHRKNLSWSILSNKDLSKFYSKTKSVFGLVTTFHIEFWWHVKFLGNCNVFELELFLFCKRLMKKRKKEKSLFLSDFLCFSCFSIHTWNFVYIFTTHPPWDYNSSASVS